MESALFFKCSKCGKIIREPTATWTCSECGAPLEIVGEDLKPKNFLGEGGTPLIKNGELFFKLEYLNPSGSFKDRGVSYTLYYFMKKRKCSMIIEDSSGNTGISTSLYSSHLGLTSIIYVPKNVSSSKEYLLRLLGAKIVKCKNREEAWKHAWKKALEKGNCYIGHVTNPIFLKGVSTMIDEIPEDVIGEISDVIIPVSSGTLLLGIYRGLLNRTRNEYSIPRLWAVQPIENSYLKDKVTTIYTKTAVPSSYTIADALVVSKPPRLDQIISVINHTDGGVVIVGNNDIFEGIKNLYKMGFIVEPSSAVVWPAFKALESNEKLSGKTLLPLTGSGLKYIDIATKLFRQKASKN